MWNYPTSSYRFASELVETYVKVNRTPLAILRRLLATLSQSYIVGHHFCPVIVSLFLWNADFTNCPKGSVAHLCWSHSAVSRCCMQISIWKHSANHDNYCPSCNYRKYCLVLWSWAFPEGDIENYWSVTECHLKSPTLCSWEQQSYPGAMWASIEDTHIKEERVLLRILRWKSFLSHVHNQGGTDQSNLSSTWPRGMVAPSHYLSQCWPSSLSPYGVIRPQRASNVESAFMSWRHSGTQLY